MASAGFKLGLKFCDKIRNPIGAAWVYTAPQTYKGTNLCELDRLLQ